MFSFLTKIDVKDIPAVRAFFNCMSSVFTYGLLIGLILLANFSWITVLIAFIGIEATTLYSLLEDKNTLKIKESKVPPIITALIFTNFLAFWSLIAYLCFNVTLEGGTYVMVTLAFIFSFIRVLASSLFVSPLMKSLKEAAKIQSEFKKNKVSFLDTFEKIEKEHDNIKKQMKKATLFAFIPSLLGVVFLWLAFYRIFVDMNIPVEMVLYVIFVVIMEIILSNFTKKLKKELISKTILEYNE